MREPSISLRPARLPAEGRPRWALREEKKIKRPAILRARLQSRQASPPRKVKPIRPQFLCVCPPRRTGLCVLPAAVGLCEKKICRGLPTVGRRTRNSAINPTQIKQKAMGTEGYFLN
jgi:hypothetical protein